MSDIAPMDIRLFLQPKWSDDSGWSADLFLNADGERFAIDSWLLQTTALGDQQDFARWSATRELVERLRAALARPTDLR